MVKADDHQKANTATLQVMNQKVTALQNRMKDVNKLESQTNVLYKWKNEHTIKLIENEALMKQIESNMEYKVDKVCQDYKDTQMTVKRIDEL